jgi:hypothetical protein
VGRETILRDLLIQQTPEPFKVKTGFVVSDGPHPGISDQCDILVYDPRRMQPYYRIAEFEVVDWRAVNLVIEVRSNMDVPKPPPAPPKKPRISGLEQTCKVWESIRRIGMPCPTFGFGFNGSSFPKFVQALADTVQGDIYHIPSCIAVHERNYLALRVFDGSSTCIAVNFCRPRKKKEFERVQGLATASFLGIYGMLLQNTLPSYHGVRRELSKTPRFEVKIIRQDGSITDGPLPETP